MQHEERLPWSGTPAFVGRLEELAVVRAALRIPGSVTLIVGEAGMGKSRLLHEALADRRADPALLTLTCPPLRTPLTLGPIVAALRGARLDIEALQLDALAGVLRPILPEWPLPPPLAELEDPFAARQRTYAALQHVIERAGVSHLVVEDLHWADESTVELLLELTALRSGPGVLATIRTDALDPDSLVHRLATRPRPGKVRERIDLRPFGHDQSYALLSSMVNGAAIDNDLVDALQDRTEGLPLALEESMRHLRANRALTLGPNGWTRHAHGDFEVPPALADAYLENAHSLGPQAVRVLQATAVLAEHASAQRVGAILDLTARTARHVIDRALEGGLIVERADGALSFRHVLAADALYGSVPGHRLRQMHRRAAALLEEISPQPVAQLIRHYQAAGDVAAWAHYTVVAARTALAAGDDASGIGMLVQLASNTDLPLSVRHPAAIELAEADAFRRAIDGVQLESVISTLRTVTSIPSLPSRKLAPLRSKLGRLLTQVGRFEDGRAELLAAIDDLDDHESAERVRALVYLGGPYGNRLPASACVTWLHRAAASDLSMFSVRERLTVQANLLTMLLLLGDESGWTLLEGLPETVENTYDGHGLGIAHANAGYAGRLWGRYDEARRQLQAALRWTTGHSFARLRDSIRLNDAHMDWLTGRWQTLPDRLAELGGAEQHAERRLLELQIEAAQRDAVLAEIGLRELLAGLGPSEDLASTAAAALAELLVEQGRVREAVEVTATPVSEILARGLWVWGSDVIPARVRALMRLGEFAACDDLVEEYATGLGDLPAPAPQAALVEARALVTEPVDPAHAAHLWEQAATSWAALPNPRRQALALRSCAESLTVATGPQSAVPAFTRARRVLAALGALRDLAITEQHASRAAVHRSGVRPVGRPSYGNQLSPREAQVLERVVAGCSNREIADILGLSHKTVERHVQSLRHKLGATSRTGLVMKALEAGLVA